MQSMKTQVLQGAVDLPPEETLRRRAPVEDLHVDLVYEKRGRLKQKEAPECVRKADTGGRRGGRWGRPESSEDGGGTASSGER